MYAWCLSSCFLQSAPWCRCWENRLLTLPWGRPDSRGAAPQTRHPVFGDHHPCKHSRRCRAKTGRNKVMKRRWNVFRLTFEIDKTPFCILLHALVSAFSMHAFYCMIWDWYISCFPLCLSCVCVSPLPCALQPYVSSTVITHFLWITDTHAHTHTHTICWQELKAVYTLANRGVLVSLTHKRISSTVHTETALTPLTHLWSPNRAVTVFPSLWHKRINGMKRFHGVLKLYNVLIMI